MYMSKLMENQVGHTLDRGVSVCLHSRMAELPCMASPRIQGLDAHWLQLKPGSVGESASGLAEWCKETVIAMCRCKQHHVCWHVITTLPIQRCSRISHWDYWNLEPDSLIGAGTQRLAASLPPASAWHSLSSMPAIYWCFGCHDALQVPSGPIVS